jgi:hypothetical protein
MQTKTLIAALAALTLAGPVRAQDAKPAASPKDSIMTFFKHLKESLSQSAVQGERKKNARRSGSVAAVRGASQSSSLGDPNEPVLKGDVRSRKDKLAMAEDAEFSKGVDLVLAGKTDEGVKALEDFKAKHPKSHNLEKVQQAIDQARALSAAKPAEAAAPDAAKPEAPKDDAPAKK